MSASATSNIWTATLSGSANSGVINVNSASVVSIEVTAASSLAGTLQLLMAVNGKTLVNVPGCSATLNASSPVIFEDIPADVTDLELSLSSVTGSGVISADMSAKVGP